MLDGLASAPLKRPAALRAAVWVLAIAGPALLTVAALPLDSALFRSGFQFSALVLVVMLAVAGGMRPALTALVLTMLGQALFFAPAFMKMMKVSAGLLPGVIALAGFTLAGVAVSKLTGKAAHLAAEHAAFRQGRNAGRAWGSGISAGRGGRRGGGPADRCRLRASRAVSVRRARRRRSLAAKAEAFRCWRPIASAPWPNQSSLPSRSLGPDGGRCQHVRTAGA